MLEVSIVAEGHLLMYLYQYLQMSDLWVAPYTVHHIFSPLYLRNAILVPLKRYTS